MLDESQMSVGVLTAVAFGLRDGDRREVQCVQ
jgi:hypothetical protein